MIAHLRDRYRDIVHLLDRLEIAFPRVKVRMEYVDRGNEGKKGAFRVHPRLPVLQIWPDIESGRRLLRVMPSVEGEIIQRIHMQERLREPKKRLSGPVPGASRRGGMTGGWSKNHRSHLS